MRDREVRIELERPKQLLDRLVVRAAIVESPANVRVDDERQGVELLREQDLRHLLLESAHRREELVIPVVGGRVVGIDRSAWRNSLSAAAQSQSK